MNQTDMLGRQGLYVSAESEVVLEKARDVLFALKEDGVVLHNISSNRYCELDGVEFRAWSLLDGSRSVREMLSVVRVFGTEESHPASTDQTVIVVVNTLIEHGYLVPRADSGVLP
jgi:hypothetical protein